MENILLKAAEQSPNLVVLTVIVWLFLKHIREQSASVHEMLGTLHQEAEEARIHSREVIERNTSAMAANSEVMRESAETFRELMSSCRKTPA